MDERDRAALIDRVAERTQGTAEDPLTRGTIEKVIDAALKELGVEVLPDREDSPADAQPDGDDTAVAGEADEGAA